MRSLGVDAELLQRMMRCVRRGDLPWNGEKDLHLWKKMGMILKELGMNFDFKGCFMLFEVVLKYDICCFLNCSSPSLSKGSQPASRSPAKPPNHSTHASWMRITRASLISRNSWPLPWSRGPLGIGKVRGVFLEEVA